MIAASFVGKRGKRGNIEAGVACCVAGTTTTCEAIFMGVPVITLAGACHAHNVGVSLLSALGMHDDWVCATRSAYVAAAARWAAAPAALMEVRAGLRARMLASPLCDAAAFMPGLEAELEACFRRWEEGAGGRGGPAAAAEAAEDSPLAEK